MTRLAHLIASIGGAAILASCSDSPVAPPEGPGVALAKENRESMSSTFSTTGRKYKDFLLAPR